MAAAAVAAANSNDSNASVGQRRGSIGDVDSNAVVMAVMPTAPAAAAANSNGSNGSSGQRRGSIDDVDSNCGGCGYGGGGGGIK